MKLRRRQHPLSRPAAKVRAVTLLELVAAIAIILILATLVSAGWQMIARQAARANCIANMRNIHVALSTYVTDTGHWPQIPLAAAGNTESYETWWIHELKPLALRAGRPCRG